MPLSSSYYNRLGQAWRFRSKLEQILIGISTVSTFLVVLFIILLMHHNKPTESYCSTSTCLIEAAKIVEQIDPNVNPCEDFYKFVCGKYMKTHDEEQIELPYKQVKRQIYELYFEPIREDDHYMVKFEKKLFKACMNTSQIRADNLTTVKEVLQTLGGWPIVEGVNWDENKFNWLQTTYKLRKLGYSFGIFFDLGMTSDPRPILQVSLPSYRTTEESIRKQAMMNDALLFGADTKLVAKDIEEMYNFEQKLKTTGESVWRDYPHTVSTANYFRYGDIDWLEFINNLAGPAAQISIHDPVIFPQPENLNKRLDIISNTSKRTQANYLIWRVLQEVLPYTSVKNQLEGKRPDYCVQLIRERFITDPMFIVYARKTISKDRRKRTEELISNVKNEVITLLHKIEWLDKNVKQKIKDKIDNITVVIVQHGNYIDDKMLDDLDVDMKNITNENFLNLLSQANRNFKSQIYGRIHKSQEEIILQHQNHNWFRIPHLTSYNIKTNVLTVSPTALQNSVFNENRPNYLNYGILGTNVASHLGGLITNSAEIFHENGERSGKTRRFENLPQCVAGMAENNVYSFMLPQSIVGSKLSYDSYRKSVNNNGEESKLVATQYSTNQLFWISTVICAPGDAYHADLYSQFTNTSLRNNPDFAKDFRCPVGSPMNPSNRCHIF